MTLSTSNKRTPPFSLRLSREERAEIEKRAEAAGLSLGGYCKSVILGSPPRRFRRPQVDRVELARLLGELGRVGNNLNQLTRLAHSEGAIQITELKEALIDLAEVRAGVMLVLGYRENYPDTPEVQADDH